MSKYGFDQEEVLISKKVYIDKDGFYHEEYVEESDDSESESEEESITIDDVDESIIDISLDTDYDNVNVLIITDGYYAAEIKTGQYLYFGDAIDDSNLEVNVGESGPITIDNANELNLIACDSTNNQRLTDNKVLYTVYASGINNLPENWEELQAHVIFIQAQSVSSPAIINQIHQL